MKICVVGNIYSGLIGKPIGGGEHQINLIMKYLNKIDDVKIHVIDTKIKDDIDYYGIKLYSLRKRSGYNFLSKIFYLYKILKKINADIYYGRIRSSLHLLSILAARKNKSKFIYHVAHDLDTLNLGDRWNQYYKNVSSIRRLISHFIHSEIFFPFVLKYADLIITQHNNQSDNLDDRGYENIFKLNNLFEPFEISEGSDNIYFTKNKYYAIIGSIDIRKGIKELFYLINKVKNKNFLIIGKPRDLKGKKFINKIKKYDNVQYIGQLDRVDIYQHINNSNALISTSLGEGFPNIFLESWSLGKPVLSLNIDPGGIINRCDLGKYYSGDIDKMAHDINNNNNSFNDEKMKNYVIENYDSNKIAIKLYNKLKLMI